ncbi:hypothetical protein FB446DRAFT_703088 [Lentinula raphanica]|nr:hypothetical protein FB446DRAFT_703088 [Lentinula raphanica]
MSDIQPAPPVSTSATSKRPRHDTVSSASESEPAPIKRGRIQQVFSSSEDESDEDQSPSNAINPISMGSKKPQRSNALTFSALGPPQQWETLENNKIMKEMTTYAEEDNRNSGSKSNVPLHSKHISSVYKPDPYLPHLLNVTADLEADALNALAQALGVSNASWSSEEQRYGVLGSLDKSSDMIVIAKTGSGKTMIPIISSLIEPNTWTIVAIPLVSLIHDYERRLSQLQIPYHLFTDGHTLNAYTAPPLILVSGDLAVRHPFRSTIKAINAIKPVGRFLYDEGQLAVTDSDYRNPLRDAQEFRCVDAPLIIMTGTAPPISVPVIAERFGLVTPYLVARGCTDRPELCLVLEIQRTPADIISRCNECTSLLSHEEIERTPFGIEAERDLYGKRVYPAVSATSHPTESESSKFDKGI